MWHCAFSLNITSLPKLGLGGKTCFASDKIPCFQNYTKRFFFSEQRVVQNVDGTHQILSPHKLLLDVVNTFLSKLWRKN